jgi:hypothetical protein
MNPLITSDLSLITIIRWRFAFILIALVLGCLALLPGAQAVNPPPDGGYPNGNTAEGANALFSLTSGVWNTALGFEALNHDTVGGNNTATGLRALFSDTGGNYNSATGVYALYSNVNGWYNNAVGAYALANNIGGNNNTANGYGALNHNTADANTASGFGALYRNTTGSADTANGYRALNHNISGGGNTANGFDALYRNTTGGNNTANGFDALYDNATGSHNTANGVAALVSNIEGNYDTANGYQALASNTSGSGNTADGVSALFNNSTGEGNTAIGYQALDSNTGSFNVAINGGRNLTTGDFNVDIANNGVAGESNTTRIGILQNRCFISGIREVTTGVPDAINVMIDSAGQLGTVSSSRRFKKEIKPMDKASDAILALKPVTFHYKTDNTGTPQFGLIAEEVAEVNPDLVVRDEKGEIYTVRYDAVNAMLLNEFLKEHRKVQKLEAALDAVNERLKEQAAKIQKVSDQVQLSKPTPHMVASDR